MIFELLAKMLGNQTQNSQAQQHQNNPAFDNYPKEAFIQSNDNNSSNSTASNLFSSQDNNSMLPLLLSLLGKNGNSMANILDLLGRKDSTKDNLNNNKDNLNNNEKTQVSSTTQTLDDDILL